MSSFAWIGIALRFLYIFSGLKSMIERARARQEGRRDEQLERMRDELEAAKEADRIRNRVDSDPSYYDELRKKYTRD